MGKAAALQVRLPVSTTAHRSVQNSGALLRPREDSTGDSVWSSAALSDKKIPAGHQLTGEGLSRPARLQLPLFSSLPGAFKLAFVNYAEVETVPETGYILLKPEALVS